MSATCTSKSVIRSQVPELTLNSNSSTTDECDHIANVAWLFEQYDEEVIDEGEYADDALGLIYKLTSPSGNAYIGQTMRTFQWRCDHHEHDFKRYLKCIAEGKPWRGCRALYNAFTKYGFDSFKKEVIYVCKVSELNFHEKRLIEEHDTLTPNGYNLMTGGGVGRVMSEETRRIMAVNIKAGINVHIESYRKHNDKLDGIMPMGVNWYEPKKGVHVGKRGYRVKNYINPHGKMCNNKVIADKTTPINELAVRTLAFLAEFDDSLEDYRSNQIAKAESGLQKGIRETQIGYYAEIMRKGKRYHQSFSDGPTKADSLTAAIAWIKEIGNNVKMECSSETQRKSAASSCVS